MSRRILITNMWLSGHSGTELHVRDLAETLMRRGDRPVIYSPNLGPFAETLRDKSIPVVDRLDRISIAPDIIHGHHSLETVAALMHFPKTPALFVCHDSSAWHDTPPPHPRVLRYVAVDEACRERLTQSHGADDHRVSVIHNAVDLDRFTCRNPLPAKASRALVFSGHLSPAECKPIERACEEHSLSIDYLGQGFNRPCEHPEQLLQQYDLVFAKGRCAREAMATGTAVVICDKWGLGQLVTSTNVSELNDWNFGRRTMNRPLASHLISNEISKYSPRDSERVRDFVRKNYCTHETIDRLSDLYDEVIDENSMTTSCFETESRAIAVWVTWWSKSFSEIIEKERQDSVADRKTFFPRIVNSFRKRFSALAAKSAA